MAALFEGKKLLRKGGDKVDPSELKNKVVALYFSAHWCPPCRAFTPILKDFYEELEGQDFEVVFVSFDREASDLKSYMDDCHGDWCYIEFGDQQIQSLGDKFGVQGIPSLIVVNPAGKDVQKNGRGDVQNKNKKPTDTLKDWKALCFP